MRTLIVIPARLGSWRFPDKPLMKIYSMPMIEHVYRRAQMVKDVDRIVIATPDEKVKLTAESFGAEVLMTSREIKTACERVGAAAKILGYTAYDDVIINVQGDEPVVPPPVIELTREILLQDQECLVANMVEEIKNADELDNPHRIKAILSAKNNLLYLSRVAVPSTIFDIKGLVKFLRLTCITAYRGPFLELYQNLPRTSVELIEGNDMMRTLEHEVRIRSGISPYFTHPVDTIEDVECVMNVLKNDQYFQLYRL